MSLPNPTVEFLRTDEARRIISAYMPTVWPGDESEVTDEEATTMAQECLSRLIEAAQQVP